MGVVIGGRCGSCRTADLQSSGRDGAILFDGIAQPWLKEAAKRWARARLLAGGAPSTMAHYVHHVAAFSGWLADRAPEVVSPAGITRVVLEDWLLSIRSSGLAAGNEDLAGVGGAAVLGGAVGGRAGRDAAQRDDPCRRDPVRRLPAAARDRSAACSTSSSTQQPGAAALRAAPHDRSCCWRSPGCGSRAS